VTPSFSAAWLDANPSALALLPADFRDAGARARAVERARRRAVPAEVLEAIKAQNAELSAAGSPSAARDRNVAALAEPGTVVVATGQQVGLFLGPLYTLYKAASAIACARALERQTGARAVPVFWLQTEDHDVQEIDHAVVPRAAGAPLRVRVEAEEGRERVPVAHRLLGPSVEDALAAVRAELGAHPYAAEHLGLLERTYAPGTSFGAAFARVLASIFGGDDPDRGGLVLLDPRDARLAPLAAPVHRRALLEARGIADELRERTRALEAAGFDAQVHVRPGSPLSFYAPDAPDGPRYRLDPAGDADAWRLVGRDGEGAARAPHTTDTTHTTYTTYTTYTTAGLLEALEREPLRFTTSALLRPLLQDSWLPTAAYVGGPAEIGYFAQLMPLYERFGLSMPMPVLRARFRILDDRTRALLEKLDLSPDDASRPKEELLAALAARARDEGSASPAPATPAPATPAPATPDHLEERLRAAILPELASAREAMAAVDPSLERAANRAREAIEDAIERLVAKYGRALAQRDQVTVERLDRLATALYPDSVPQERVYGLSYFACRYGRTFLESVIEAVEPFAAAQKDLSP
jgi:bacillithiol synthase